MVLDPKTVIYLTEAQRRSIFNSSSIKSIQKIPMEIIDPPLSTTGMCSFSDETPPASPNYSDSSSNDSDFSGGGGDFGGGGSSGDW